MQTNSNFKLCEQIKDLHASLHTWTRFRLHCYSSSSYYAIKDGLEANTDFFLNEYDINIL